MSPSEDKAIRVIVADDEDIVVSLVRDALEDEGYQIETASDGQGALTIIKSEPIDLIVTDIRMPHMDGIEMVRQAREIHPDVVVIFMTGYADLSSAKNAIKQGAFEYIMKPFELSELRQAVANAAERIHRDAAAGKHGNELDRLSDLNQMLYEAGDKKSLATLSLKYTLMHCRANCGAILYWNADRTGFTSINVVEEQTEESVFPDQPLADCVEKLDLQQFVKPFQIEPGTDHPFYSTDPDHQLEQYLMPRGLESVERALMMPVRRSDTLYAILTLGFNAGSDAVKDTNLKFLSVAGSQLALSLENLRLLQEAQDAYNRLKELQDETIQLEKMATRGEMSAEIGHELNNFLGVVAGNLSLLEFHLKKEQYDQLHKYVHGISDNIDKIKRFTGNLMDLTPISSSKEIVYFEKLLAEVVDYLRPQKRYSGVTISIEPVTCSIPMEADITHLQQLLYNLFNNAADATADCETREIHVWVEPDEAARAFGLTIRDTGSGIDPELLTRAFNEKFTTKKTGHGFGLLVCRRIIDNHGGKLTIESAPGQGTSIRIDFPMVNVTERATPSPS
ncbi:MAG: response regulator [candidate division Zixibacteria bacterium]|nr:response regulator [candidate division Zixibacteria bacterium]